MLMNNYLLQLLKEVKTLIIPGLGALTITNDSTGEILFMPYLKYDDGTLAKHISEKEKLDENDAKNMISKFVREVIAELDKGGSYDMYQFGSFIKVDGEVAFKNWTAGSATSTPPKTEEKPIEKTVEKEVVKEEKIETPPVTETVVHEPTATSNEIRVETPVEPVKIEEKQASTPPIASTTKKHTKANEEVKKVEKVKPAKAEKPKKEKKKRSDFAYVMWGVLAVIIGFGIYVAVNFNNLKKDFPILAELAGENDNLAKGTDDFKTISDSLEVDSHDTIQSEPIVEDELATEETNQEVQVEEPKKETVVKSVKKEPAIETTSTPPSIFDASLPYHIIAGSFGSEANANKLADKLRSDGFAETTVSMNSGMYRVSIKGFSSIAAANSELQTIRSKVANAWVMKMK